MGKVPAFRFMAHDFEFRIVLEDSLNGLEELKIRDLTDMLNGFGQLKITYSSLDEGSQALMTRNLEVRVGVR
jgi:hypothetical protein